jgi:hypothetical protein
MSPMSCVVCSKTMCLILTIFAWLTNIIHDLKSARHSVDLTMTRGVLHI